MLPIRTAVGGSKTEPRIHTSRFDDEDSFGYGVSIPPVGRSIVLGYVPAEDAGHGAYEIKVFGEATPTARHDRALYDPGCGRILA